MLLFPGSALEAGQMFTLSSDEALGVLLSVAIYLTDPWLPK
jgi:hypothetical protein